MLFKSHGLVEMECFSGAVGASHGLVSSRVGLFLAVGAFFGLIVRCSTRE